MKSKKSGGSNCDVLHNTQDAFDANVREHEQNGWVKAAEFAKRTGMNMKNVALVQSIVLQAGVRTISVQPTTRGAIRMYKADDASKVNDYKAKRVAKTTQNMRSNSTCASAMTPPEQYVTMNQFNKLKRDIEQIRDAVSKSTQSSSQMELPL